MQLTPPGNMPFQIITLYTPRRVPHLEIAENKTIARSTSNAGVITLKRILLSDLQMQGYVCPQYHISNVCFKVKDKRAILQAIFVCNAIRF